jgi:hypothetical protein
VIGASDPLPTPMPSKKSVSADDVRRFPIFSDIDVEQDGDLEVSELTKVRTVQF